MQTLREKRIEKRQNSKGVGIARIHSVKTYYAEDGEAREMEIRLEFKEIEGNYEVIFQNFGFSGWLVDEIFVVGTARQKQIYLTSPEQYDELIQELYSKAQIKNVMN